MWICEINKKSKRLLHDMFSENWRENPEQRVKSDEKSPNTGVRQIDCWRQSN